MSNLTNYGYFPADIDRSESPEMSTNRRDKAFLGGVLGIEVNDELQPISEAGIVDLTFVNTEAEASAQAAAQSASDAEDAKDLAVSAKDIAVEAKDDAVQAKDDAETAQGIAEGARDASLGYMLDSSKWATGQISGQDVPSTDPTYQNNSKYYSQQAASSATAADGSAEDAEAYAVGKRDGVDVSADDPAYQNNSKYYATEAANSASAAAASAATLVLDPTLTEAAQAAQAKATGDAVADVNNSFNSLQETFEPFAITDWEQGTISTNSGNNSSNTNRIRLINRYIAIKDFTVKNVKGYTVAVFKYNADGSFKESTGFPADDTITSYNISKGDIVRLVVSKYPIAETTVSSYNKLLYIGLTNYDEKFDDLESSQTDFYLLVKALYPFDVNDWEQGTLKPSTGENQNSLYRIRLKDMFVAPSDMVIQNKSGFTVSVFKYTDQNVFVENTGFPADDTITSYNISKGDHIRLVISKYPIAYTTVSDGYNGILCIGATKYDELFASVEQIEDGAINEAKSKAQFYETADISFLTNKYYVGADKQYTTINAALTAWANDNYPPAVVYISNGEYNETIFVEDKTIAFIGESKDGTIIRTKSGAYSYPPFKIHHGNVLIANLTAIADHSDNPSFVYTEGSAMAYAFHIDGGSVGGEVVVRNCRAVSYQSPALGMGLIPDSKIRLEDVEAYTYTEIATGSEKSLQYGSILCHMPAPSAYPNQSISDSDVLELINVMAYAKNSDNVLYLSQSESIATMALCCINLITASGNTSDQNSMVHMPTNYNIDVLSSGNSCKVLNK